MINLARRVVRLLWISLFLAPLACQAVPIVQWTGLNSSPLKPGEVATVSFPLPLPEPRVSVTGDVPESLYFTVRLPANYTESASCGVIVFMNSGDSIGVPDSWTPVLDSRHLIFIAPQAVGNKHPVGQRIDAAVKAALLIKEYFLTDPKRVYVAGLSGGARIASDVALAYPEIFHGTIQCSGSDYFRPVSRTAVTDGDLNAHPEPYGESSLPCRQQEVRSGVRFVLITGTRDWREHFIEDIYKNGFQRDGFQALLLDLPNLGHAVCSGDNLEKALQFIEDGKPQGDAADLNL